MSAQQSQDALYLPFRELGRRLHKEKLLTVELTELSLERLESHGPRYNALVTLTRERAMENAHRAEAEFKQGRKRGPLHGIPMASRTCWPPPGAYPPPGASNLTAANSSKKTPPLSSGWRRRGPF